MTPIFEKIQVDQIRSISSSSYRIERFDIPYHFHPEFEIVYIKNGIGKVFVDEGFQPFGPKDLFLFGSDVPHLFIETREETQEQIEIEVIHFNPKVLSVSKELPEFESLSNLVSQSKFGLKCNLNDDKEINDQLNKLINSKGITKYLNLILFLYLLDRNKNIGIINKTGQTVSHRGIPDKLNRVTEYIFKNYNNSLSLQTASDIACMNKAAFCRYFKKHTRKSFGEYVNDLRIDYSTKLLVEQSLTISEISYAVGFNSVPYFIKQFKKSKKITPKRFREKNLLIQSEQLLAGDTNPALN